MWLTIFHAGTCGRRCGYCLARPTSPGVRFVATGNLFCTDRWTLDSCPPLCASGASLGNFAECRLVLCVVPDNSRTTCISTGAACKEGAERLLERAAGRLSLFYR